MGLGLESVVSGQWSVVRVSVSVRVRARARARVEVTVDVGGGGHPNGEHAWLGLG